MSQSTSRSGGTKPAIQKNRRPVSAPVVCNLAAWFNAPDVGYQPHYGRKKRTKQ